MRRYTYTIGIAGVIVIGIRAVLSTYHASPQEPEWVKELNNVNATITPLEDYSAMGTTSIYSNSDLHLQFEYPRGVAEESWTNPSDRSLAPNVTLCAGGDVAICDEQGAIYIEKNSSCGIANFKQRNDYFNHDVPYEILESRTSVISGVPVVMMYERYRLLGRVGSSTTESIRYHLWIQFVHGDTLYTTIVPDDTFTEASSSQIARMLSNHDRFPYLFTRSLTFLDASPVRVGD